MKQDKPGLTELYRDAIMMHYMRKGYSEFEAKILAEKALKQYTLQNKKLSNYYSKRLKPLQHIVVVWDGIVLRRKYQLLKG